MDPFSTEGELINIHTHFHQGQYDAVISFDTTPFSAENILPARVLQLRARIALGPAQAAEVVAELDADEGVGASVELQAVRALGLVVAGEVERGLGEAERLAGEGGENVVVQVMGGSALAAGGRLDEALVLLGKHQGSIDAVALIVQIYLAQNRNDLALKEVSAARRWAQDSLPVNLAESWVGLRLGGERYQQAFYVFEELAQSSSTASVRSLIAQAVAELHLGRLDEAEAALRDAVAKDPACADAIADLLVLSVVAGKEKDAGELLLNLEQVAPRHHLLVDIEEKSTLFDRAAEKYAPKVAA